MTEHNLIYFYYNCLSVVLMAGKSSRNPLLSGAGISFPFENFTNSTLLVPVPQNEPPFIPEGKTIILGYTEVSISSSGNSGTRL